MLESDTVGAWSSLSVSAGQAVQSDFPNLIVRVQKQEELSLLGSIDPEQVAWVEVPLDLAHREELNRFSVDVLLTDPGQQAADLYPLAGLRDPDLPRLSVPTKSGFTDAVAVGMALHFPIRLIPIQPDSEAVAGMAEVLERYLHDPNVSQAVEPFYSALTALLQGESRTLWDAVEFDPAYYRCEPPHSGLEEDSAVAHRINELVQAGAECATCPLQSWCGGWFKWPDPAYDCTGVRGLFGKVEDAARQLEQDLEQAVEANP
jgi:hypothetical protein